MFFLHSDARVELQRVVLVMSTCTNALGCWHAIGLLETRINEQLSMYTINMVRQCTLLSGFIRRWLIFILSVSGFNDSALFGSRSPLKD